MDCEKIEKMTVKLPARARDVHKRGCGTVLVVAGSRGMTGAGALASMAALRSGAGLVTWALPQSLNLVAETMCIEVLTLPLPETPGQALGIAAREHVVEAAQECDAVVLGPGMVSAGETGELMRLLVPEIRVPLVVDAGALRAVGEDRKIFLRRRAPTVVTPHPGEMSALCGLQTAAIQAEREKTASDYARQARVVTLLKGAGTVVSDGAKVFVNPTGNPGMATAGAGDVLAGVVAALLAAGLDVFDAAALGAYLHGMAGDLAVEETGVHGLIAGDILQYLPSAFCAYGEAAHDN